MIRATIDTNVIISGLLFQGIPLKVLDSAVRYRYELVLSAPLILECERVIFSRKFGLKPHEGRALLDPIIEIATIVVPSKRVTIITRCPGDNEVLACAKEGRCDFIVTGDRRDLLTLREFDGIPIVSPRNFMETIG